jgi:transposase
MNFPWPWRVWFRTIAGMGKFRRKDNQIVQEELWVRPQELARGPVDGFYAKLNGVLEKAGFTESVHRLCEPHYKTGGRPPVDPAVMFKMLIAGFLEGIGSERGIASRCADSLTLRRFLGFSLTEETPDHSTFTVFRGRLPKEVFDAVHLEILKALKAHGLLKGRNIAIDSSVIEANAALSGLSLRNTEQKYRDYVKGLAREAGVDAEDAAAVARFDKKRKGRTTSNEDWHNPHDPDAKVGRTKDGACDMIYKPEHTVDLDSGAVIAAEVRAGDAGDTEGLAERIVEAVESVEDLHGKEHAEGAPHVKSVTADKGYFAAAELAVIQEETGARTVISDPNAARRKPENAQPEERRAVERAARAVKSKSGKALLKKRGEKVERSFAHVLDCGALRRTMLRGLENINKRYLCGIIAFNLSLIMRKLTGLGTPRQTAAARLLLALLLRLLRALRRAAGLILTPLQAEPRRASPALFNLTPPQTLTPLLIPSSTGC